MARKGIRVAGCLWEHNLENLRQEADMLSMKRFRFMAMAILAALAVSLAAALPGVSADGGGDKAAPIPRSGETSGDNQAPPIPEKAELNYPNLGSHLDQLVASLEAGQATAQGAASNSPLHSGESVAVTIYLTGNVDDVVGFLEDNGGDPRNVGEDYIEAYVPVPLLGALSEQPGVIRVREILPPEPEYGPITSQGVQAHLATAWHDAGYTGQGIKVGIIDTGFEGFSGLMGAELPATVQARCYTDIGRPTANLADCENGNDHGTIVAESLIDIAPQVDLYIGHPVTPGDLQALADWMVSEGVSVINHSVSWSFDGPGDGNTPYSNSPLRTVGRAVSGGVVWVNAAGNSARTTWFARAPFLDQDIDGIIEFAARDETNNMTLKAGDRITVQLRWDDNWGGARTNLNLGLWNADLAGYVALSRDPQLGGPGHNPYERIVYEAPFNGSYSVLVGHASGSMPDWIQLTVRGVPSIQHYTKNGSIANPAESDDAGMLAVGAAHWDDVHAIWPNSSRGPTPDGRVKPDVVGADCGATALRPLNEYNSGFCGTSQASPHVAGMAALVRQRFPGYTPAQVASYLKDNAEQRQSPDPNDTWGHGFATLPPPDGTAPPVPVPSNVFTRNPAADFDTLMAAGNYYPQGIWSDGTTMWVSDFLDEKIYAYDTATRVRVPDKDFDTLQAAGNTWPKGVWSDGTTMWVADFLDEKIYAYDMATKARVPIKEFDTLEAAGNQYPEGIWSDGTTMWVADSFDEKVYAYEMATRVRVPSKDFDTLKAAGNRYPRGIWSDGATMWVADSLNEKVYAYDLATKARVPGREFNTLDAAGNWEPGGIWSDGTTMWVADWLDDKIYAYRMRTAVVFGDLNWTSALLQTEIARYMVEHGYGYATEKVFGSTIPLLQGLREGDIHLLMEVWLPSWSEQWEAALSAGDIVDLGTSLGNDWQSAFVIPAYLQEQYPGLDHVEDLKQQEYRSLFSTAETGGKARLMSCVVGWTCEEVNRQQIEGYGLQDHVHIINPGTAAALNESLKGAYQNREPWLGYQWGTNEPALLLDLVRLEEPAYSDECWSTGRACAYENDTILIGAHSSLPELAPNMVDFLEQWDFSVDVHLRYATRWMDANPEALIEEAALNWLANHVDTWSAWVTEDAAAGILATLPEVPVDLAALVALYNATGGPNWTNNTNWLTAAPIDQWYGVTADSQGRVAGLNLTSNQLRGEIPPELANLTNLELLALGGNELTGTIPTWLGSLTKLEGLYLFRNELSGEIPTELGSLFDLRSLHIDHNQLTGEIPAELASLTQLQRLDLSANQLSGTIPEELGSLANLVQQSLWGNELSGEIPAELGSLSNLELLSLSGNELSGEIPAELGSLANLVELWLGDNQLSGTIPEELGSLTKLEELHLWGNGLSGEIPTELASLAQLQRLSLSDNQLTGTIPAWLGSLTKLEELSLWGNGLTGEIPAELASLTELQRLSLSDNQLTGALPAWLGSLIKLTELSLWGNDLTGEIPASLGLLEILTQLHLSGNQLTGCVPAALMDVEDNDFAQLGLPFCETPAAGEHSATRSFSATTVAPGTKITVNIALSEYGEVGLVTETLPEGFTFVSGSVEWTGGEGSVRQNGSQMRIALADSGTTNVAYNVTAPSEAGGPFEFTGKFVNFDGQSADIGGASTVTVEDEDSLVDRYDVNNNGTIEIGELFSAIDDYFAGRIDISQLFTLIDLYFSSPTDSAPPVGSPTSDREALAALYNATGGPNWRDNTNWLSDAPLDEWQHVSTDSTGRVNGLFLNYNQLTGEIPADLGNLSSLEWLDLTENELTGEMPAELSNLANLEGL